MREAGDLPIRTVIDPDTSALGIGPHMAMSEMRDAGMLPTNTVGNPVTITPPPCTGQAWESEIRADGNLKSILATVWFLLTF